MKFVAQSVILATGFLSLSCTPAAAQQAVYGTGHAKDGDSLMVGDKEVRRSANADFVPGSTLPSSTKAARRTEWAGAAAQPQLLKS